MLQTLLDLLRSSDESLSKERLSQELGISLDRLEQMLTILQQKGKINVVFGEGISACQDSGPCPSTGKACPGPSYCALLMDIPMTIEVVGEKQK